MKQEVLAEERFSKQYSVFVRHKKLVQYQYAVVQTIKSNLNEETCTVQMDLAAFLSSHGEEIQFAYFNKKTELHCIHLQCTTI